jgi:hemoglobin/transferrin/lactoferrin receptor protein
MAQAGLRWDDGRTWAELLTIVANDADRLNTRDQGDTSRIPPGGTPGYAVLHARAGTRIGRHVDLLVGLDNVFDEDYRIHGSGQNMPGRNLIVSLAASF